MSARAAIAVLFAALLIGRAGGLRAETPDAKPTKADEMKAAAEVSSEAERWAASQKDPEPAAADAETVEPAQMPGMQDSGSAGDAPEPAKTDSPKDRPEASPPPPSAIAEAAPPPPSNLNEMVGTIVSVDTEQRLMRLSVEGGYNVQFAYDHKTVLTNGGTPIKAEQLFYGDKVQIRYAGKNLYAVELERLEKVPRPFAE